jgi:hypothetical protein
MKAITRFFKTSPLSRGRLILHLTVFGFLTTAFTWGGIFLFTTTTGQDRIGCWSFIFIGVFLLGAGIAMINPKMFFKGVVQELPPDNDSF